MKISKPEWLKICRPKGHEIILYNQVDSLLKSHKLTTVCNEALCPNRSACWSAGTATFMILGDTCTRFCSFCNVKHARKGIEIDANEGVRIANASAGLKLNYVVLTSVDRDDLPDLGANHFANCISAIRSKISHVKIEVLTPDFDARPELIKLVIDAKPDVFAHNIEAVERLQNIRDPRAKYRKSLEVLKIAKKINPKILTKSSIILGVGEKEEEVLQALKDLREVQVDAVVIGQYLQPSKKNLPVKEFVTPEKFQFYGKKAKELGFKFVVSEPFARTSYKADEIFKAT
ncbi:Lipoyl synthase [Candidatus Bilamarchaeum dharawalense]|uniref:Lipoyl synthase n=1 Tax=Candidatus Bilamarchaeum dharawalense TaxID=2885759 RepID=A0A5E4LP33_9ARCH|nr:Lipoyl synthase [Candidatus Bilamarchaeum dharawalense]